MDSLATAGHRGQKDDGIAGTNAGLKPLEMPDILVVDVDIDKATERVARLNLLFQRGILYVQIRQHVGEGLAFGTHLLDAANGGAQDGCESNGCHEVCSP